MKQINQITGRAHLICKKKRQACADLVFLSFRPWPLSVVTSFANTASRGGKVVPLVVSSTVPTAERKSPPSIQTSPSTTSSSHSSGTCQTSNRQIGGRPLKSAKVSQHHQQKYPFCCRVICNSKLSCLYV